jgi:2,4-dienoyl-CoA reductase-like NADH-dependent reductase (Old Yellow Enzyme family)
VAIDVPRGLGYSFAKPREMTEADIEHTIRQFASAAQYARRAGFTGVQLHAAHGYLISQFLSPLSNRRTDRWGGPLESRSRFLLAIVDAVRGAVGSDFPIGIKLNSSDFQKGGFTNAECIELVVRGLNDSTLDLLELSGGSLEQPKLVGVSVKDEGEDRLPESTIKREAYFVEFASAVRTVARMPVMVTGGFRTASGMVEALEGEELDLIGIGRPLIADRFHSEAANCRRDRKGTHTRSDPRSFPYPVMVRYADRAHGRRFGARSHFIGTGGSRAIRASGDRLYGATLGKTQIYFGLAA